jgi:hypothetical protein
LFNWLEFSFNSSKWTLKNSEGAIKNGQSRETGNIDEVKQNKANTQNKTETDHVSWINNVSDSSQHRALLVMF